MAGAKEARELIAEVEVTAREAADAFAEVCRETGTLAYRTCHERLQMVMARLNALREMAWAVGHGLEADAAAED